MLIFGRKKKVFSFATGSRPTWNWTEWIVEMRQSRSLFLLPSSSSSVPTKWPSVGLHSLARGILDSARRPGCTTEIPALAFLMPALNWVSLSACLLYLLFRSLFACFVYRMFFLTQPCYTVWKTQCSEMAVANIHTQQQQNEHLNSNSAWIARVTFLCSAS